jgi:crotonobetainyl-CoA:carnitine CoA-transferase CaiB-like acyl-CoA transferase
LSNALRIEYRQALRAEIERSLRTITKSDLCDRLMRNGVPAGPVNSVSEAISQPHARHRQMMVRRDQYQGIGLPVRLMRTPGQPGADPRPFNADARVVLRDAGYLASEVEQLITDGVIPSKNVDVD